MRYFGFGLLGFGVLEVMSVFWMAGRIGGGMTFVLMVLSAMAGVFMLRRMGLSGVLLAASAARGGGDGAGAYVVYGLFFRHARRPQP